MLNHYNKTIALAASLLLLFSCNSSRVPAYKDASLPSETRARDLVGRMTLEEKLGQLLCPLGWPMYEKISDTEVTISDAYRDFIQKQHGGMLWATFRADPWTRKTLETGLNPQLSAQAYNALQHYAIQRYLLAGPDNDPVPGMHILRILFRNHGFILLRLRRSLRRELCHHAPGR